MNKNQDEYFIRIAIDEAEKAIKNGKSETK